MSAFVESHEKLVARVSVDVDSVLAVLSLVAADSALTDRLWSQLVDLLVEAMLLDVRGDVIAGRIDQRRYALELEDLARRCRAAGLLPLRARRG
jgi:hypothetical protein